MYISPKNLGRKKNNALDIWIFGQFSTWTILPWICCGTRAPQLLDNTYRSVSTCSHFIHTSVCCTFMLSRDWQATPRFWKASFVTPMQYDNSRDWRFEQAFAIAYNWQLWNISLLYHYLHQSLFFKSNIKHREGQITWTT